MQFDGRRRVIIEGVSPSVDDGRYPAKRCVGDEVRVEADVFRDGHDLLRAVVRYRAPGANRWRETEMQRIDAHLAGVRWAGSTDVTFGDSVFVNTGVLFDACAPISIGRKVHLGHDVRLLTATHRLGPASSRAAGVAFAPIRVGDGAWIGAAVTVLSGVTIGEGCVVAAGAVVVRDCEPNGLYGGIPARRLRDLDDAIDVNDPCAARSLTRDI